MRKKKKEKRKRKEEGERNDATKSTKNLLTPGSILFKRSVGEEKNSPSKSIEQYEMLRCKRLAQRKGREDYCTGRTLIRNEKKQQVEYSKTGGRYRKTKKQQQKMGKRSKP